MKTKTWKKIGAAVIGVALLGGLTACTVPEPCEPVVNEVEVIKEVPVEVVVEVEKLVEVDNGNLALVTERLEDLGVYEDADEVVLEIQAEDAALALGIAEIKAEGFDLLEKEDLFADEDDLDWIKIKSDFKDVEVIKSDFDRDEYKFVVEAKVEDYRLNQKKYVLFTVEVEDGEADLVSVEEK